MEVEGISFLGIGSRQDKARFKLFLKGQQSAWAEGTAQPAAGAAAGGHPGPGRKLLR